MEVIDGEFRRIVDKYKKENSSCQVVDFVRIDFPLEVFYLPDVVDGLPCTRAIGFAFSGGKEIVVNDVRYEIVFISDGREHVLALIEVLMFRDRCFISKDFDEDELEFAVRKIEEELPEEES